MSELAYFIVDPVVRKVIARCDTVEEATDFLERRLRIVPADAKKAAELDAMMKAGGGEPG